MFNTLPENSIKCNCSLCEEKELDWESHVCTITDMEWDNKPDLSMGDGGDIYWGGTCPTCKKRLYQIYKQEEGLFTSTGEQYNGA